MGRIRVVIRGQTRIMKWHSGTSTMELDQTVRDLAQLSGAAAFTLVDAKTKAAVFLSPTTADGTTLEMVVTAPAAAEPVASSSDEAEEEGGEEDAVVATAPAAAAAVSQPAAVVGVLGSLPSHWSAVRGVDDDAAAVEVTEASDPEVWSSLSSHIASVGTVTRITRCEDADQWQTFVLEKKRVVKRFKARANKEGRPAEWRFGGGCWASGAGKETTAGGDEERVLFHTANASVAAIFEEGFDMRLAAPGNFGKGVYFSDDPNKCDAYWRGRHAGAPTDGTRVIFVAQVILGEAKVYRRGQNDKHLLREPERNAAVATAMAHGGRLQQHSTDRYDSVEGYINTAAEMIIYQNARAYPQYAVHYIPKPRAAAAAGAGANYIPQHLLTAQTPITVHFVNSGVHELLVMWVPTGSTTRHGRQWQGAPALPTVVFATGSIGHHRCVSVLFNPTRMLCHLSLLQCD